MKSIKVVIFSLVSLILLSLASCLSDPYSPKNSQYYQAQALQYRVMDMHIDCPTAVMGSKKHRRAMKRRTR